MHLTVLDHGEALVVETVDSPREVYSRTRLGARRPLHCTSTGKVLLAFLEPEAIDAVLAGGLRRLTESTLVDPEALLDELSAVRGRGFSRNCGEFREVAARGDRSRGGG